MFGYITPDKPNMYIKDYTIYKAFYCGICKCNGKIYGQLMRFTTNYDITFFCILLHNILNEKFEIKNETCILNPIKKKSIVKNNTIMTNIVYLNALLTDFKLSDDIEDSHKISKRLLRNAIKGKIKKASKALPEVYSRIEKAKAEQRQVEAEAVNSLDKTAHPFASMLKDIFKLMCKDKYTEEIGSLSYQLGRFIYFSDAVDDIDMDIKAKQFNPFKLHYTDVESKIDLLTKHMEDIDFLLNSAYNEIKHCYRSMDFKISEGIITNILWLGLESTIKRILSGDRACRI